MVFASRRSGRFAPIGVAAFAVVLVLWVGHPAQAGFVTRNVNVTLNAQNIESYDLDVDLNGTVDFTFTAALALDPFLSVGFDTVDFPFASNNAVVIDAPTGDGFPTASRLNMGDTVSAGDVFSSLGDQGNLFFFTTFDAPSGNFGGQTGFVGLRFDGDGGTLYGFAQITVNDLTAADNPLGLTIGAVGYNTTPGAPVQIPVPAPAGVLLFGTGGLSLLLLRIGRKIVGGKVAS